MQDYLMQYLLEAELFLIRDIYLARKLTVNIEKNLGIQYIFG